MPTSPDHCQLSSCKVMAVCKSLYGTCAGQEVQHHNKPCVRKHTSKPVATPPFYHRNGTGCMNLSISTFITSISSLHSPQCCACSWACRCMHSPLQYCATSHLLHCAAAAPPLRGVLHALHAERPLKYQWLSISKSSRPRPMTLT
jgi:hypothetical protein